MKKKLNVVLLSLSLFILCGCPTPMQHIKTTHFVTAYRYVNSYELLQYNENSMLLTYLTSMKKITESSNKEKYEALSAKHNDIGFVCNEVINGCAVMDQDFSGLSIKTKTAYDDEHPAGADIGDITTFFTTTIAPFVESGYKNLYPASKVDCKAFPYNLFYPKSWLYGAGFEFSDQTNYPNHFISKKTKELSSSPLIMIGSFLFSAEETQNVAAIVFDKAPKLPGAYEIELNIKTTEGKEYNLTCTMNFD